MAELREISQSQRREREEEEEGGEEDEGPGEFLPGYPTFEDYSKVSNDMNDRSEHIASHLDCFTQPCSLHRPSFPK